MKRNPGEPQRQTEANARRTQKVIETYQGKNDLERTWEICEQDVIRKAMAILGSRTSAAKKRSSRLNGMKRAKSGKGRKINVKRKVAQANR